MSIHTKETLLTYSRKGDILCLHAFAHEIASGAYIRCSPDQNLASHPKFRNNLLLQFAGLESIGALTT